MTEYVWIPWDGFNLQPLRDLPDYVEWQVSSDGRLDLFYKAKYLEMDDTRHSVWPEDWILIERTDGHTYLNVVTATVLKAVGWPLGVIAESKESDPEPESEPASAPESPFEGESFSWPPKSRPRPYGGIF